MNMNRRGFLQAAAGAAGAAGLAIAGLPAVAHAMTVAVDVRADDIWVQLVEVRSSPEYTNGVMGLSDVTYDFQATIGRHRFSFSETYRERMTDDRMNRIWKLMGKPMSLRDLTEAHLSTREEGWAREAYIDSGLDFEVEAI